eukprot:8548648-Pyramimonas_sp.AAC.1
MYISSPQRLATRLLHQLNTQYSSMVNDRLMDGVRLAYEFQRDRFLNGVERDSPAESGLEGARFGITAEGRDGLNATYQMLKGGRSLRNRFLGVLLKRCVLGF